MKYKSCPVFKATGKRKKDSECQSCPFNDNCPEDKFNDTMAEIIKDVGDYLNAKRNKVSAD